MAITTLAKAKTILGITGTDKDELITALIELVEDDYKAIQRADFEIDDEGATVYPTGSEMTAIQMIGYRINMQKHIGEKSESLADHAQTFEKEDMIGGYPKSVVGGIKRYASFQ